jgi:hypothetical protein
MKLQLALCAEWAWSEGLLNESAESRADFACLFQAFALCQAPHTPSSRGGAREGRSHIEADLLPMLRALAYGRRAPTALDPRRKARLSSHDFVRAFAAFLEGLSQGQVAAA